jgi:N6-adenosine-specific RNA methylase IME4
MTKLVQYDAARKALASATRVDEVKSIRDKAVAMAVYAKLAKDGDLIAHATAIRKRAERRLGELMEADRKTGKLKRGRKKVAERPNRKTLSDQGIDKHLADRARKSAAMSEEKFEKQVARSVQIAVAATEGDAAVVKAARKEQQAEKTKARAAREVATATKIKALPNARYGVVYADPEWKDEVWDEATGSDRAPPYATSAASVIAARDVDSIAAPDAVLFLWTTNQHLRIAIHVMEAWGFEYKSNYVWHKDKISTGRWNRSKHEILLIGTRGKIPAPAMGTQWESVQQVPKGRHSAKPECFMEMIEQYYPNIPKIELNARKTRPGWSAWGAEAPAEAA